MISKQMQGPAKRRTTIPTDRPQASEQPGQSDANKRLTRGQGLSENPQQPPETPASAQPSGQTQLSGEAQANEALAQAERRLSQMRQALGQSHRLTTLGTLAAVIAHEYHNMLTPVISYAQFALSDHQSEDPQMLRKALGRALAHAQDAAELSQTILSFARDDPDQFDPMPGAGDQGSTSTSTSIGDQPMSQAGPGASASSSDSSSSSAAGQPNPGTAKPLGGAEVRAVIDQSLACLGREPTKDGIELEIDVPAVRAAMPAVSLQQVLVNLLLNSRKAMVRARGLGGGKITLTAQADGPWIDLRVIDTGPGIDPAEAAHLFEPFVSHETAPGQEVASAQPGTAADDGNRRAFDPGPIEPKGTGLGLCVCRELIHAVGGTIEVESTPGQGASFKLRLPRAEG